MMMDRGVDVIAAARPRTINPERCLYGLKEREKERNVSIERGMHGMGYSSAEWAPTCAYVPNPSHKEQRILLCRQIWRESGLQN